VEGQHFWTSAATILCVSILLGESYGFPIFTNHTFESPTPAHVDGGSPLSLENVCVIRIPVEMQKRQTLFESQNLFATQHRVRIDKDCGRLRHPSISRDGFTIEGVGPYSRCKNSSADHALIAATCRWVDPETFRRLPV